MTKQFLWKLAQLQNVASREKWWEHKRIKKIAPRAASRDKYVAAAGYS